MARPKAKDKLPVTSADEAFEIFERSVREWRTALGLDTWRVTVVRNDDDEDFASCHAEVEYAQAIVTVNPVLFFQETHTPLQIESTAVHELVHAVLWPAFNELANPAVPAKVLGMFEETTTEVVAMALMRAKYGNIPAMNTLWNKYTVEDAKAACVS